MVYAGVDVPATLYWSLVTPGGMQPTTATGIVLWQNTSPQLGSLQVGGGGIASIILTSAQGIMPGTAYVMYITVRVLPGGRGRVMPNFVVPEHSYTRGDAARSRTTAERRGGRAAGKLPEQIEGEISREAQGYVCLVAGNPVWNVLGRNDERERGGGGIGLHGRDTVSVCSSVSSVSLRCCHVPSHGSPPTHLMHMPRQKMNTATFPYLRPIPSAAAS